MSDCRHDWREVIEARPEHHYYGVVGLRCRRCGKARCVEGCVLGSGHAGAHTSRPPKTLRDRLAAALSEPAEAGEPAPGWYIDSTHPAEAGEPA